MPQELLWQRYRMDAPLKSGRATMYAVFDRPPGQAIATRRSPGLILSFKDWPDLLSLSSAGKVRWRRRLEAPVKAVALDGAGGSVYAALAGGALRMLSPDGKPLWEHRMDSEVTALAASEKGGCAAVGDRSGALLLIGIDGKPLIEMGLPSPAASLRLAQDGSTLICADAAGGVSLITRDGKTLWRKLFGDGITDMATTGGCTRTLVLSGSVHGLLLDGSERWTTPAPKGAEALRMSEDGETAFVIGPQGVVRLGPSGKKLWDGDLKNRPAAAAVISGLKMLILPDQSGANLVDRWGNLALECPIPAPAAESIDSVLYDGLRSLFFVRPEGGSTHLFQLDIGPALVDYLLRAARIFGNECAKIEQPSPFGDRHFLEATSAAKAGDFTRVLENAQFAYRYYEETLTSTQHPTDTLANPDSLTSVEVGARRELEAPLTGRSRLYQAKCSCGALNSVYTPQVPLLIRCSSCGKLGLIRTVPK